ncbi:MAG: hypothetical protein JXR60_04305 [Bacteroidales bacterium]|nr:hypothetical protein [Bacteroidales bacterium]
MNLKGSENKDIKQIQEVDEELINKLNWKTPELNILSISKTLSGDVNNTTEDYSGS